MVYGNSLQPLKWIRFRLFRNLLEELNESPTIRDVAGLQHSALPLIANILASLKVEPNEERKQSVEWLEQMDAALLTSSLHATQRIKDFDSIAQKSSELADMDFTFLYDPGPRIVCHWV